MTDPLPDLLERLKALERAVARLTDRLDALDGPPPEPARVVPEPPPVLAPPPVERRPPEPPPVQAKPPAPDFEWRFGATWLNRLGAAAILLAVAFFLSYSFQHGWIPPWVRCAGGGLLSLALVGWGERLRRRGQRGFSQGITGAGIGIAYVAAYAAHGVYRLVGAPAAFALLSAATALSFLAAAWGNAQAVAVLGYLGGLATPVLLSTGKDSLPALLPYLALLCAGAVYQGRKRGWTAVRWIAWAGSAVLLAGWAFRHLGPLHRDLFALGALALGALFQADALTRERPSRSDPALLALNAVLASAAAYLAWEPAFPKWMGTLAVLGASVQGACGWRAWRKDPSGASAWTLAAHAAALLAVAVPLQFDGKGVALGWGAQVLVAAWAGRRIGRLSLHAVGAAALALGHLLFFESGELASAAALASLGPWTLTTPLAAFLGVAAACLAGAVLLGGTAAHALVAAASLAALGGTCGTFPSFAGTLPWIAWAGALFAVAASRWEGARAHAWLVVGLAAVKLWLLDVLLMDGWRALAVDRPVLNLRMASVCLSAAVLAFPGLADPRAPAPLRASGLLFAVVSLVGGINLEIHRLFVGSRPEPMSVVFDERFVVTAAWAAGALALVLLCRAVPELSKAAWALGLLFLAKFWVSDVLLRGGWEGMGAPRALLSARTLAALAVTGIAGGLALRDRTAPGAWRAAAGVLAAFSLLGWGSLEIHRAFVGTGPEPDRLEDGEQIAHSAAWALGAALALGIGLARDLKPLRLGGLAGIALVAAKILLVDLSGVAPIYRVGILFVLGVLSLGASWAYHRRG